MTQINVKDVNQDTQIQQIKKDYLSSVGLFTSKEFVIEDDKTAGRVSDTLRFMKVSIDNVIKRRKEITKGIDDSKAVAMKTQHEIVNPMEADIEMLKPKLNAYIDKKEKEQEEEERRLRQIEIDKEKEKMAEIEEQAVLNESNVALKDAIESEEKIEELKTAPIIKKNVSIRSNFSSVHRRITWHVEVTDIKKLPAMYKMVNQKLLDNSVRGKDGLREIAGCRIFSRKDVSSRK